MQRDHFSSLQALITVARESSFTRAADQLGVSQSALSHTIKALESKLGVRLLTRTTRSVSATEAGQRLIDAIAPRLEDITNELLALSELRDKPAGTVRITATDHAANKVLWPRLSKVLLDYPELNLEIVTDYGLTDIVADRFDAGVRLGDQVAKDMIAVRIAADMRMTVVGAPGYLATRSIPETPEQLADHRCINLRLPTRGGLYAWEFQRDNRELQVRVEGQLTFNNIYQIIQAALDGYGLAYMPEDLALPYVASGQLQFVLEDWCPTFPGLHIFYPSRRQNSPALKLIVDTLRYEG